MRSSGHANSVPNESRPESAPAELRWVYDPGPRSRSCPPNGPVVGLVEMRTIRIESFRYGRTGSGRKRDGHEPTWTATVVACVQFNATHALARIGMALALVLP